jgi:hypothetical protein
MGVATAAEGFDWLPLLHPPLSDMFSKRRCPAQL